MVLDPSGTLGCWPSEATIRSSAVTHPGPTTSWLLYWVGRLWMWVFGWDVQGDPAHVPKAVLIAAPHTSNWDLPHMLAAALVFRLRVSWLGKHSLFRPPFGWILRLLGGIPVDRSGPHGLVGHAAQALTDADQLVIAVPPSGTRSRSEHWKSGFYWIAHTAKVPIICGYLDYGRRVACLGEHFLPSGNVRADMDRVREIYEGITGKFPELMTPIRLKEEASEDGDEAGPREGHGAP